MVRKYVKKRILPYTETDLQLAVEEYQTNGGIRRVSEKYKIPKSTLKDYVNRNRSTPATKIKLAKTGRPIFNIRHSGQLIKTVVQLQRLFYGLKHIDICRAAYEFAEILRLKHNFKRKNEAGKDWLKSFIKSQNVDARKDDSPTQLRDNISSFFQRFEAIMKKCKVASENIYNLDELVLTGHNCTLITAVCPSGGYVQPMVILPDNPELKFNATENLDYIKRTPNGQITVNEYMEYLKHFIQNVCPREDRQIILILDGLFIHKNLHAVKLCAENFIHLLVVPPNTISRLQPLHGLYENLKNHFFKSVDMAENQDFDLLKFFDESFQNAFKPLHIARSFETKGIYPFNRNIVDEDTYFFSEKPVDFLYYWNIEDSDDACTFDASLLQKYETDETEEKIEIFKDEVNYSELLANIKTEVSEESNDAEMEETKEEEENSRDSSSQSCPDLDFFKSILPDVADFTPSQKRLFKQRVLTLIEDISTRK